ncbi:MAG: glycosyltransferase [Pelagibacterales bacterium]|nr:glycosyltransferase [Pelagibacterales bacterium]
MKIYIGHDSRFPQATKVCRQSIKNYNKDLDITFLEKDHLKKFNFYGREDISGESTEFSFTRFYVPMVCNYNGIAMFCDNDFLWKCDPTEMLKYLGDKTIAVVKHEDMDIKQTKMDGMVNKSYPRKNWSSLIIYNCSKLRNLSKEYLDNASASDLHELKWVNDNEIAEIPRSYNHLVGYYKKHNRIKALHYTLGGPWFDEYKNGELSEEWWKVYKSL